MIRKLLPLLLLTFLSAACSAPLPTATPLAITPHLFTPPPETPTLPLDGTSRPTPTFVPSATSPLPTPLPFTPPPLPTLAPDALSPQNAAGMHQLFQWSKGRINGFTLSPDGRRLILATTTGVHVYDATTLEQTETLAPNTWVSQVAIHPNGDTLALASGSTVEIWSLAGNVKVFTLTGHTDLVSALAFNADGRFLASGATGQDNGVGIWDTTTGQLLQTLLGPQNGVKSLAFAPNGITLAAGDGNFSLFLWDVITGQSQMILQGHASEITALAFSPDGAFLASGSAAPESQVKVWDLSIGQTVQILVGHMNSLVRVAYSPAGDRILTASLDHTARIWDPATGFLVSSLDDSSSSLVGAAFHAGSGGSLEVVTANVQGLRVWSEAGEEIRALDGYSAWVGQVAFNPNGLAAIESYENVIEYQDVSAVLTADVLAGPPTFTANGHTNLINALIASPDGRTLASTGWDGTTRLWDTASGALLHTLVGHQAMVWTGAFSPDGNRLATGSLTDIRLWDVNTGQPLITLIGHASWVTALAFSPNGRYLASASFQEVWVWDAYTGQRILQISGHPQWVSSLTFSPDSRLLATGGGADDYTIRVFEMPTGRGLAALPGHLDVVGGLAFNPDGTLLASGSRDGVVRVWDMTAFKLLVELTGHALWVDTLAFSPDGNVLVSGGLDGTVRVWGNE